MMTLSERLALRLRDVNDAALRDEMLRAAQDYVRAYTGRDADCAALEECVLQIACAYVNRLGMEGERSHGEGGVTHSLAADLPKELRRVLNRYRRVGTWG